MWYKIILAKFKFSDFVTIHQFAKFSSSPKFIVIQYYIILGPSFTLVLFWSKGIYNANLCGLAEIDLSLCMSRVRYLPSLEFTEILFLIVVCVQLWRIVSGSLLAR